MSKGPTVTVVCDVVQVIDEQIELSHTELCRSSGAHDALVLELVAQGLLDPSGAGPGDWRFAGPSLALARRAQRLIDDLGLNAAGAAVVIELLDRIEQLEQGRR